MITDHDSCPIVLQLAAGVVLDYHYNSKSQGVYCIQTFNFTQQANILFFGQPYSSGSVCPRVPIATQHLRISVGTLWVLVPCQFCFCVTLEVIVVNSIFFNSQL